MSLWNETESGWLAEAKKAEKSAEFWRRVTENTGNTDARLRAARAAQRHAAWARYCRACAAICRAEG